jgi:UDP-2-acetamido-3-amino-2,3-dideoxy-glucuronate N-acetyltransferase
MTERQATIGVIGCGYWGKNLVRNFHEIGALQAVCDSDEKTVTNMAAAYGCPGTQSVDDLLRDKRIQAVAIAAPAAQHFQLAKRSLLAGKDVFVEKPLALTVVEGEELVQLAKQGSRVLMVGHLLQYHPAILELKRLIHDGQFGRIRYITSSRLNWGKLRVEENILWSFAPHDISAILFLLNEVPTAVIAHADSYLHNQVSDVTLSTLEFNSGVTAHIFVSWLHPVKEQKLVIVGEQMMAVFDDTEAERKLVIYEHKIDWINRLPIARKNDGQVIALPREEPLRRECQHFIDSVLTRTRPLTDGENGLRVLRILRACEESMRRPGTARVSLQSSQTYFAHPSAVVDQPCEIGEGTKIWHFSHIMAGCRIGKGCNLGQNVNVAPAVSIGNNVKIQNNVSVYTGVEL